MCFSWPAGLPAWSNKTLLIERHLKLSEKHYELLSFFHVNLVLSWLEFTRDKARLSHLFLWFLKEFKDFRK